jgi:hypothetical protein
MPLSSIIKDRSTVEIMVLAFTLTASFMLVFIAGSVVAIALLNPGIDTSSISSSLLNVVSGIIGALLGLLAGKAEGVTNLTRRPGETLPPLTPMQMQAQVPAVQTPNSAPVQPVTEVTTTVVPPVVE